MQRAEGGPYLEAVFLSSLRINSTDSSAVASDAERKSLVGQGPVSRAQPLLPPEPSFSSCCRRDQRLKQENKCHYAASLKMCDFTEEHKLCFVLNDFKSPIKVLRLTFVRFLNVSH